MDERRDHLWKVAQEAEDRIEDLVRSGANPMGLDVGTSKVCCLIAQADGAGRARVRGIGHQESRGLRG